jgi:riboflavin synthase
MFTGLVEEKGTLASRITRGPSARLRVHCHMAPLVLGESIAVDGVCLTVDAIVPGGFEAEASAETLSRSTLGARALGTAVNLERATPLGSRMGGHIVGGHVDAVGTLVEKKPIGGALRVAFAFPAKLAAFIAEKGSIAVDGVSLTVNGVDSERFDVVLVPHTRGTTSLDSLAVGTNVNLEVDVIARYVARQLATLGIHDRRGAGAAPDASALASSDEAWLTRLSRAGYT